MPPGILIDSNTDQAIGYVGELEAKAGDLSPALRALQQAYSDQVESEFASGSGKLGDGGLVSWDAVQAFGNSVGSGRPLQRSGALLRSYKRQGQVTNDSVELGSSGVSYASIHRGTSAPTITAGDAANVTRVRVTRRMRIFLGLTHGVWLRSATRVLEIPARPHGGWNPELAEKASRLFVSHITGEVVAAAAA